MHTDRVIEGWRRESQIFGHVENIGAVRES
jgi:hypothetical protein